MPPSESEKKVFSPLTLWLLLAGIGAVAGVAFGLVIGRLPFGSPLVMLGIGGATLGLSGLAVWRVLNPLFDAGSVERATAPTEPGRIRDLQREKVAALKAIKEVEMDYQMRKISDADYEEMTQRYRKRALRLIGELEAGDDLRSLIEQELKARLSATKDAGEAQ